MSIDRSGLPPNVRRWIDHCVPGDSPIPNQVINTQEGEIDVRGKWMGFTARTVYDRHPFAYRWKANIRVMPGVWVVAEDGHDGSGGWGGSKMWGLIPMGGRKGPEVFKMQFARSLAELPWMPQFSLGLRDLNWRDTSDTTFEVSGDAASQEFAVTFELNGEGEITSASTTRPYDIPDGFAEAPWRCEYANYQSFGEVRIPTAAVATYEKSDGDWTYWRGEITSMNQTSASTW